MPAPSSPDWRTGKAVAFPTSGLQPNSSRGIPRIAVGSASTVVAMTIIHKYKLPLSFAGFVGKALPYAALQLGLAVIYVLVFVA